MINSAKLNLLDLLQGKYELCFLEENPELENRVPDFAYNILNFAGLLYQPIIDQFYLANGGRKPIWPDEKTFAVCLTHDVDRVALNSFKQESRRRKQLIKKCSSFLKKVRYSGGWGLDFLFSLKSSTKKDPLFCLEKWIQIEQKLNTHSTFFFWPGWKSIGRHHVSDCLYDYNDKIIFDNVKCSVAEMISEIDRRGWEIGLHPSWHSYNDLDELKRQKDSLESILQKEIVSVRQHYLRYDIRITPLLHTQAGFKFDSTLGFNDNIGFRFGTSYPWNIFNLKNQELLPIIEIPLIIQDVALLSPAKGLRLDSDKAFFYIQAIIDRVEAVGGIITLLWHPDKIIYPEYQNCFEKTVAYLLQKKPFWGEGYGEAAPPPSPETLLLGICKRSDECIFVK